MSTIVYTLVSHNFRMLPAQIDALRRNVDQLSRIVVVQGPFGADPAFSAGNRCLMEDQAKALGVELLEIDESFGGLMLVRRLHAIVDEARRHALAQPERFVIVLQGDVMPARIVNAPALLDGYQFAGRGWTDERGLQFWPTWLCYDSEAEEIQEAHLHNAKIRGRLSCKAYEAHSIMLKPQRVPYFELLQEPAEHGFEWCEPVWLHLNQLTVDSEEVTQRKLSEAARILDIRLPMWDPSVELSDPLPYYMPRIEFPRHGPARLQRAGDPSPRQSHRYARGLQQWHNKHNAVRDQATVELIYDKLCMCCEHLKDARCTAECCSGLRGDEERLEELLDGYEPDNPIRNKIRVATEHCPKWKW